MLPKDRTSVARRKSKSGQTFAQNPNRANGNAKPNLTAATSAAPPINPSSASSKDAPPTHARFRYPAAPRYASSRSAALRRARRRLANRYLANLYPASLYPASRPLANRSNAPPSLVVKSSASKPRSVRSRSLRNAVRCRATSCYALSRSSASGRLPALGPATN